MFCSSVQLELWCLHSYYHLIPLVLSYCSVGYLSDSIGLIAHVGYRRWCVSSYFIGWRGNTWFYSWTCCPGLIPLVKLHALHKSFLPAWVIVLLGLCNPPCRGCGELTKPGLKSWVYPLVWIPCCGTFHLGSRSRVGYVIGDSKSWVTCCDR
jgi:hypothetical protein